MEFQQQEIEAFRGSYLRENKSGRTSHDNFPGLIAMTDFTSEKSGTVTGFHLGWSGNNRVRVDRHSDGRAFLQMGELFYPGEMEIAPGEAYETPMIYAARSDDGLNRCRNNSMSTSMVPCLAGGRGKKAALSTTIPGRRFISITPRTN